MLSKAKKGLFPLFLGVFWVFLGCFWGGFWVLFYLQGGGGQRGEGGRGGGEGIVLAQSVERQTEEVTVVTVVI